MPLRCQALSALQASAERNFGLHATPATAGANKLYAGAKNDAVYAYRTSTHANDIAKA